MAKKEGNGSNVPVQKTEPRTSEQPVEQQRWLPAWRSENPWQRMREEMATLFDRFFGRWPAEWQQGLASERFWDADVEERDKDIVVRAEAPGFEPQDFDIHITGNTLTIQAEHKQEAEEKQEGFHRTERRYGHFQRSIPLPAAVAADKAEARYHNGVLELRLPRTEEVRRQRIEIKT